MCVSAQSTACLLSIAHCQALGTAVPAHSLSVALLCIVLAVQRPVRDEAAFTARANAALSVREKLLDVIKKLTTEVEATIARYVDHALSATAE